MEQLLQRYHRALEMTPTHFVRYLDAEIDWDAKVIAILGSRGVGKTTLIRQRIKMHDDIETTLYVDAGDLAFAVSDVTPNVGMLRETAFCQMVAPVAKIEASSQTDFKVGEYAFEVGGKNKGTQQVAGLANAFIVRDDTEYRSLNFVPLWHFGFLY